MAIKPDDAAQRAAYWPVPVARAVPAAAFALAITFSADHSARFGLVAFGCFGIVAGVVLGTVSWRRLAASRARSFFVAQAIVTAVIGILALLANTSGVRYLFLLVTVFAVITGALELYSGARSRRRYVVAGDWVAVGAFTVILAIVFLVIPPGYTHTYHDPDGVTRVLDSAVVAIGLLGAYSAIVAVYLLIAGFSAKWGTQKSSAVASESAPPATIEHNPAESETSA